MRVMSHFFIPREVPPGYFCVSRISSNSFSPRECSTQWPWPCGWCSGHIPGTSAPGKPACSAPTALAFYATVDWPCRWSVSWQAGYAWIKQLQGKKIPVYYGYELQPTFGKLAPTTENA